VSLEISSVGFQDLISHMERTFRQVAEERNLDFHVEMDPKLPPAIQTDSKRLQQVLRNLLSNAFKFTEQGGVTLRIGSAEGTPLRAGSEWVSLSVTDTGIGIPEDKQRIIFEAFQQADGTTSRKYGGTGLGLSISREIARLLGGEIVLSSAPGRGSTFTLFLPLEPPANHVLPAASACDWGR
jgi:signal transduction histidine kinase